LTTMHFEFAKDRAACDNAFVPAKLIRLLSRLIFVET
jgi:hypothetical protein